MESASGSPSQLCPLPVPSPWDLDPLVTLSGPQFPVPERGACQTTLQGLTARALKDS